MRTLNKNAMPHLPEHLDERCQWHDERRTPVGDGPIVVWLKSLFRVHENPVLDVGRWMAAHHDRPLLVYHGLDERYPHANLRHHSMVMDSAEDMARGCAKLGLRYAFHVARKGHRPPAMKRLAEQASMIVTDLFPMPPWTEWVRAVGKIANGPLVEVDGHCVIPMPLYGKSVDRPFKFRDATKKFRKARLQRAWPTLDLSVKPYLGELPFTPVESDDLANPQRRWAILRACDIDPTVWPVFSQRGGEQRALERWEAFKLNGLNGYARRRNDAANANGVSRMSAFIHYGNISVMKIARESAGFGTKSADKYLDELLVFREHPWHHVFATTDPHATHHLPDWARRSWRSTINDPRPALPPYRALASGKSPHRLWNACQTGLLRHGELHNNVRMTWGKAFPFWTPDLETSLKWSQTMNDTYALDGRDPSSVGGVHWCHGLFDRAFQPPQPILGLVRQRNMDTHASRLDMAAYVNHTQRPAVTTDHPIVVIGAGIAGVIAARILADQGLEVLVLDKGRRVGGRLSRRLHEDLVLTHGASHSGGWPRYLQPWIDEAESLGYLNTSSKDEHTVVDGPALLSHWLEGIDVITSTKVTKLEADDERWHITDEDGHQWQASGVVLTAPLPQATDLLGDLAPSDWSEPVYDPTWTVLVRCSTPPPREWMNHLLDQQHVVFTTTGEGSYGAVAHLNTAWSRTNLEFSRADVLDAMTSEWSTLSNEVKSWLTGASLHAHRWRYGRANSRAPSANLPCLAEAGDAFAEAHGTVGGAACSGAWAAARLSWMLTQDQRPRSAVVQQTLF